MLAYKPTLKYFSRRKQLCGMQFNRQKPLLNFIVDFYCAKAKLMIEVDGSQHFDKGQHQNDIERDKALKKINLQVMRFDNRQILLETESVLEKIYHAACQISPSPSLPKRGNKSLPLSKRRIEGDFKKHSKHSKVEQQ